MTSHARWTVLTSRVFGRESSGNESRPWMTVDVRDNAASHSLLLESDRVANGERYIAWSTERRSYEDIVATIEYLVRLHQASETGMQATATAHGVDLAATQKIYFNIRATDVAKSQSAINRNNRTSGNSYGDY